MLTEFIMLKDTASDEQENTKKASFCILSVGVTGKFGVLTRQQQKKIKPNLPVQFSCYIWHFWDFPFLLSTIQWQRLPLLGNTDPQPLFLVTYTWHLADKHSNSCPHRAKKWDFTQMRIAFYFHNGREMSMKIWVWTDLEPTFSKGGKINFHGFCKW